mgnify:CR=1 FL=1
MLSPETSTPSTSTPTPRRGRRFARALRRREALQDLADLDPLVRDSRGTVYRRSSHEALRARVDLLASQQRAARVAEEQRRAGAPAALEAARAAFDAVVSDAVQDPVVDRREVKAELAAWRASAKRLRDAVTFAAAVEAEALPPLPRVSARNVQVGQPVDLPAVDVAPRNRYPTRPPGRR